MRDVARKKQALAPEQIDKVLKNPDILHAVLAANGEDGYPYAAPISFAYDDGVFYLHTAKRGYRVEAMDADARVCLTVVEAEDTNEPESTADFVSVIAFGKIRRAQNDEEHHKALVALRDKYIRSFESKCANPGRPSYEATVVWILEPEHMTGKIGLELLKRRKAEGSNS